MTFISRTMFCKWSTIFCCNHTNLYARESYLIKVKKSYETLITKQSKYFEGR